MTEGKELSHPISALEDSLNSIQDRGEIHNTVVPWFIYTNDVGYGALFPEIHDGVEGQEETGKLRVSLLSGTGGILSLSAELPSVDVYLVADNNLFVPRAVKEAQRTMQRSLTPREYYENFPMTNTARESGDPFGWLVKEEKALGDKHFLCSQENYSRAREALLKATILPAIGNFSHAPYMRQLGEALQNNSAEIVHAHMTDVVDWHPEILETLHLLPFHKDAVISWSTNKGQPDEEPLAQVSHTLEGYMQDVRVKEGSTDYYKRYENMEVLQ